MLRHGFWGLGLGPGFSDSEFSFFFLFVAGFRDDTSRSRNSLMVQDSQTRKENKLSEIDIEAARGSKPLIP